MHKKVKKEISIYDLFCSDYWQLLVKRRWVSLLYDWFNDLDIFLVVQLFNDEWK